MREFAIIDDDGKLFGLPAKTFTSFEAAESVMHVLQNRRAEMKAQAEEAAVELAKSSLLTGEAMEHRRQELTDCIQRWELEGPRRYTIYGREVSPWAPQM